jgi:hypothetical protein
MRQLEAWGNLSVVTTYCGLEDAFHNNGILIEIFTCFFFHFSEHLKKFISATLFAVRFVPSVGDWYLLAKNTILRIFWQKNDDQDTSAHFFIKNSNEPQMKIMTESERGNKLT